MGMLSTLQLVTVTGLTAAAASCAGWTLLTTLGTRGLPGCGINSACHDVTTGRWSRVGPVPVALIGTVLYSCLLIGSLSILLNAAWVSNVLFISAFGFIASCCIGATAWFTFLQAIILRRFCIYCTLTHVCAGLASVVIFSAIGSAFSTPMVIGIAFSVVFAFAQIAWKPKRYAITSLKGENIHDAIAPQALARSETLAAQSPTLPKTEAYQRKHRNVVLCSGRVKLDIYDFPLIGSPDAQNIVAALVDFTCRECHHQHRLFRSMVEGYPNS